MSRDELIAGIGSVLVASFAWAARRYRHVIRRTVGVDLESNDSLRDLSLILEEQRRAYDHLAQRMEDLQERYDELILKLHAAEVAQSVLRDALDAASARIEELMARR